MRTIKAQYPAITVEQDDQMDEFDRLDWLEEIKLWEKEQGNERVQTRSRNEEDC